MWNVPLRVGGSLSQIARRKGAQRSELCVAEHASVFNAGNVLMIRKAAANTHMICRREMQRINQRSVDEALLNLIVQPVVNFSPYH